MTGGGLHIRRTPDKLSLHHGYNDITRSDDSSDGEEVVTMSDASDYDTDPTIEMEENESDKEEYGDYRGDDDKYEQKMKETMDESILYAINTRYDQVNGTPL